MVSFLHRDTHVGIHLAFLFYLSCVVSSSSAFNSLELVFWHTSPSDKTINWGPVCAGCDAEEKDQLLFKLAGCSTCKGTFRGKEVVATKAIHFAEIWLGVTITTKQQQQQQQQKQKTKTTTTKNGSIAGRLSFVYDERLLNARGVSQSLTVVLCIARLRYTNGCWSYGIAPKATWVWTWGKLQHCSYNDCLHGQFYVKK